MFPNGYIEGPTVEEDLAPLADNEYAESLLEYISGVFTQDNSRAIVNAELAQRSDELTSEQEADDAQLAQEQESCSSQLLDHQDAEQAALDAYNEAVATRDEHATGIEAAQGLIDSVGSELEALIAERQAGIESLENLDDAMEAVSYAIDRLLLATERMRSVDYPNSDDAASYHDYLISELANLQEQRAQAQAAYDEGNFNERIAELQGQHDTHRETHGHHTEHHETWSETSEERLGHHAAAQQTTADHSESCEQLYAEHAARADERID